MGNENLRNLYENKQKNHTHLRNLWETNENHENSGNPYGDHDNHENYRNP